MSSRQATASRIEKWFNDRPDDGEFVRHSRGVPYSLVGPTTASSQIVFTTKPAVLSRSLGTDEFPAEFAVLGGYGLPQPDDLPWIRSMVGSRELLFLGDMDSVDLLVFQWLRLQLPRKRVRYLGISDSFIRQMQVRKIDSLMLECAAGEREAQELLTAVFPDLRQTVGRRCLQMLTAGGKVELEAVLTDPKSRIRLIRAIGCA